MKTKTKTKSNVQKKPTSPKKKRYPREYIDAINRRNSLTYELVDAQNELDRICYELAFKTATIWIGIADRYGNVHEIFPGSEVTGYNTPFFHITLDEGMIALDSLYNGNKDGLNSFYVRIGQECRIVGRYEGLAIQHSTFSLRIKSFRSKERAQAWVQKMKKEYDYERQFR